MMRYLCMLLGGILVGGWCSLGFATTYYVATTGDNGNPGTIFQPFRTIQHGMSVMGAGDTLYIRGGGYPESIDSNTWTIPAGTSWGNAPVFAAYPGNCGAQQCETVILHPSGTSYVLGLVSPAMQYQIYDGLMFDAANAFDAVAILYDYGAHHIRVQNGTIRNAKHYGPGGINEPGAQGVIGGGAFSEYINLKVYDNGLNRLSHNMYITDPGVLIDGCEIYNSYGHGITVFNGSCPSPSACPSNVVIRNNWVHNNLLEFRIDGGINLNNGDNIAVYNNVVSNEPTAIDVSFTATNTKVYNNTLYGNIFFGVNVFPGVPGTDIKNTIIYQSGTAIQNNGAGTVIDNNLLDTDPHFVNAAADDFRLQATSPAINAGVTISLVPTDRLGVTRPQGAAYDIGAYEFVGGGPPPPPPPSVPAPMNLRLNR